ncbi:hypothetical protein [Glycomyces salinus]|uniref:hypothetical protein n=1 Tax=Glycomyces salinus TaxID=980294 RepID=UPI0018EC8D5C|nr:hypothetical protein [Glycomyces salinus]
MGEVTIRLNRLGLEKGRMWQALAAAIAIVLPVLAWTGAERLVGEPVEQFAPGETITLESTPAPNAQLQFLPPGDGWTTELNLSRFRINLERGKISASVQVDTDVGSLRTLLDRRAERLTTTQPGLAATNVREYRNAVNGLTGYRADLYGRSVAGSIVVVGNGDGAAATLILLSPAGQLDGGTAVADDFVSSFVLSGR